MSEVWLRMMVDYYEHKKEMEQSLGEYRNALESKQKEEQKNVEV